MSGIIPTIFSLTVDDFNRKLAVLYELAPHLHIDIMDGAFVDAVSMNPEAIPDLEEFSATFEAHLMVERPQEWIPFCAAKGFRKIIFHIEATSSEQEVQEIIDHIKAHEMEPMIAKNPSTPLSEIQPYLKQCPVLIMGVVPGREGQTLKAGTSSDIRALRQDHKHLKIQVDGGVNEKTLPQLVKVGADILNSGSYISENEDPTAAYNRLKRLWQHAISTR